MKKLLAILVLALGSFVSQAQYLPGHALTAAELNAFTPVTVAMSNNPLLTSNQSLSNLPGTSQAVFLNDPAIGWELALGTNANPITTAGPGLKVSRTENVPAAKCNNIFNNNECNSAIMGVSIGISPTQNMQINGVLGESTTASHDSSGHGEAVGVQGFARALGSATAGVAGGFFEARYDSTAARSYYYTVGIESTVLNLTGSNVMFFGGAPNVADTQDGNSYDSYLATCGDGIGSPFPAFNCNAGLAVVANANPYQYGVILNNGCCNGGIWMALANSNQAYFGSTGTSSSSIVIDDQGGGNQSSVQFDDAKTSKWRLGKNTDNTFFIFDAANNLTALTFNQALKLVVEKEGPMIVSAGYAGSGRSAIAACSSTNKGAFAWVSDGPAMPTYLGIYTAGAGSTVVPVFCNGTNWVYH